MMQDKFVHLKVHTEFSLVDGLTRIVPLLSTVVELGMPAVAITDRNNFFGLIKAYKAAIASGVKLIVGAELLIHHDRSQNAVNHITLLCQNNQGYRNLTKLLSRAYQEGQANGVPRIQLSWLYDCCDGLIALSGGRIGDVGRHLLAERVNEASEALRKWMHLFPDRFYLELSRTGRDGEEDYLHKALELAVQADCPVVATNDVCFLKRDEFEAHEARVCIAEGRTLNDPRRGRRYSDQQYLRTIGEMQELFADIPEALANTVEIAKRCSVSIELGKAYLPNFPTPLQRSVGDHLALLARQGLSARMKAMSVADQKPYLDRLEFELKTINDMGYPGYFLVVMDFIRWGKAMNIPVGPGRGSGAGSLVAFALEITDLDPLAYDLLFERFLNPQRVSMPDFDVDFCMDRRDEVIDYVTRTYGREAVSQIITFGTMAAKAVVRDVARVLDQPYALADKMSKLIPFEVGMTLSKALEQEQHLAQLLEDDAAAQEIWEMALKLEGITRNAGKHAGGVVIAPSKLTDFSPLYCDDEGGGVVTQFDKDDVEEAGLVKFDFLGLRTLTIIDWALSMINKKNSNARVNVHSLSLEDQSVYELLQNGDTTAIFQLESRGMKELIKNLKPDCFDDIIALVALFRPGPLQSGMVENFINRKHGREPIAYPDPTYQHELIKPILEPTYGIILYQEQVMQIAQELAGYTLGGADLLRRAMGKKKPEEMAKQRSVFKAGAIRKGIDASLAMKIFDLVEKFAGYGFNKSHSAAYALVSYQTAWLKTHYPAEFMAAVMSSEIDNTDKLLNLRDECRRMGLVVNPPALNKGEFHFTVDDEGAIVYALGAIKGLGEGPIEALLNARSHGNFTDLFDFCARTDSRKINRRALEALIKSGAFDEIGVERWVVLAAIDDALRAADQLASNEASGIDDLFGDAAFRAPNGDPYAGYRKTRAWSFKETLEGEKESLGSFLSGHPLDEFEAEIRKFAPHRIRDLVPSSSQTVAGLITDIRLVKTQRGNIAVVQLDDGSGQIEASVYNDVYEKHRDLLIKDCIVLVKARVQMDDFRGQLGLRVKSLMSLEDARKNRASELRLRIDSDLLTVDLEKALVRLVKESSGDCPVFVEYHQPAGGAVLRLGQSWRVAMSDHLLDGLKSVLGNSRVEVVYER